MPRGSKPGERRGGRKAGTPNKRTVVERQQLAASGLLPLDYMLAVLRDPDVEPDRRDRMASAAAPYVHAKLASVEHSGQLKVQDVTEEEALSRLAPEQRRAVRSIAALLLPKE
jgi:hypothetical protein